MTEVEQVEAERDELARQLEKARRLACHYHELLHLAHESDGFIEPDWKTR